MYLATKLLKVTLNPVELRHYYKFFLIELPELPLELLKKIKET
jgi:DNA-binding transcriptional regulator PaaX